MPEVTNYNHIMVRRGQVAVAELRVCEGELCSDQDVLQWALERAGLIAHRLPYGLVALVHLHTRVAKAAQQNLVSVVASFVRPEHAHPHD